MEVLDWWHSHLAYLLTLYEVRQTSIYNNRAICYIRYVPINGEQVRVVVTVEDQKPL